MWGGKKEVKNKNEERGLQKNRYTERVLKRKKKEWKKIVKEKYEKKEKKEKH